MSNTLIEIAQMCDLPDSEIRAAFELLNLDPTSAHGDDVADAMLKFAAQAESSGAEFIEVVREQIAFAEQQQQPQATGSAYSIDRQYGQFREAFVPAMSTQFLERGWNEVHGTVAAALSGQAPGKQDFSAPALLGVSDLMAAVTSGDLTAALPGSDSAPPQLTASKAHIG